MHRTKPAIAKLRIIHRKHSNTLDENMLAEKTNTKTASQKVMVAMSGGVDSSVAAALLSQEGHEVVGVTMKLWGGASDTGCCSVSDVEDARRVCDHLGIEHHVFNFGEEFNKKIVAPYIADHQSGLTPNPCIECNRHIKFDRMLRRALVLGFNAIATGHHARIVRDDDGRLRLRRGLDFAKDQSYVLWTLTQKQLEKVMLPVGHMTKQQVRETAENLGIRTAQKPDSQDVCFVTRSEGRESFLRDRMEMHSGVAVTLDGTKVGDGPAVELVTLGQRRNLGLEGMNEPRFAVNVDVSSRKVVVGSKKDLLSDIQLISPIEWSSGCEADELEAQYRSHGKTFGCRIVSENNKCSILWNEPQPRVAPGQSIVFYENDVVMGGTTAL